MYRACARCCAPLGGAWYVAHDHAYCSVACQAGSSQWRLYTRSGNGTGRAVAVCATTTPTTPTTEVQPVRRTGGDTPSCVRSVVAIETAILHRHGGGLRRGQLVDATDVAQHHPRHQPGDDTTTAVGAVHDHGRRGCRVVMMVRDGVTGHARRGLCGRPTRRRAQQARRRDGTKHKQRGKFPSAATDVRLTSRGPRGATAVLPAGNSARPRRRIRSTHHARPCRPQCTNRLGRSSRYTTRRRGACGICHTAAPLSFPVARREIQKASESFDARLAASAACLRRFVASSSNSVRRRLNLSRAVGRCSIARWRRPAAHASSRRVSPRRTPTSCRRGVSREGCRTWPPYA